MTAQGKGRVSSKTGRASRFRTQRMSRIYLISVAYNKLLGNRNRAGPKASPVQRREAQTLKRGPVRGGRITSVTQKSIARKMRVEPRHQPVARHLGDDRGRCDRQAERIAV